MGSVGCIDAAPLLALSFYNIGTHDVHSSGACGWSYFQADKPITWENRLWTPHYDHP